MRSGRLFLSAVGLVLTALVVSPPLGIAGVAIDQTPILRVLRASDVPAAENLELPSGALRLGQLVAVDAETSSARSAEAGALRSGFRSAAISEFGGPGSRLLRSVAVEFETGAQAARALSLSSRGWLA